MPHIAFKPTSLRLIVYLLTAASHPQLKSVSLSSSSLWRVVNGETQTQSGAGAAQTVQTQPPETGDWWCPTVTQLLVPSSVTPVRPGKYYDISALDCNLWNNQWMVGSGCFLYLGLQDRVCGTSILFRKFSHLSSEVVWQLRLKSLNHHTSISLLLSVRCTLIANSWKCFISINWIPLPKSKL